MTTAPQEAAPKTQFQEIVPGLVYRDIGAAHDFLVQTFELESGGVERDPEGRVVHGEVRAGPLRIWLHAESSEFGLLSPSALPARHGGLVVHLDDVDAHFARVRDRGATIIYEPADEEYGHRGYGVKDLEGHDWWFATPFAGPALHWDASAG
jgi:uncharacterized glyoxalase superfamily protein PhnB